MSRCVAPVAITLAVAMALAGCGSGTSKSAVVRVGGQVVTKPMVDHWQSVLSLEGRGEDKSRPQTVRQQAIALLIAADWLIAEAAQRHHAVSEHEVDHGLQQQESGYPSKSEFDGFLKASGKTVSDLRLEIRAELASEALRRMVSDAEPRVTPAQVATYYAQHQEEFTVREQRNFDIVNNLTIAQAQKLKMQVAAGKDFSSMALHEALEQYKEPIPGEKRAIVHAIFAARPHVIGGPEPLLHDYSLFEVTAIRPASVTPLAKVQETIEQKLAATQQHRAMAEFTAAWIGRWKPKTDCLPAYVVSRCKQYAGPRDPNTALSLH